MVERKWQFKTKFRAKAFGWRGSRLAISRLKEAVSEIKAVGEIRPGRGRRRGSIVDGAHLAGVSGYRHLLGSAWDGGRAYAGRIDPDPHRRYGRPFDKKQVAQATVRGGA